MNICENEKLKLKHNSECRVTLSLVMYCTVFVSPCSHKTGEVRCIQRRKNALMLLTKPALYGNQTGTENFWSNFRN